MVRRIYDISTVVRRPYCIYVGDTLPSITESLIRRLMRVNLNNNLKINVIIKTIADLECCLFSKTTNTTATLQHQQSDKTAEVKVILGKTTFVTMGIASLNIILHSLLSLAWP